MKIKSFLLFFMLIFPFSASFSADLPENPLVQAGNPSITSDNRDMVINAGQFNKTWIDWQGFNIGSGNSVTNIGPGAGAVILHRDVSGAISDIQGALNGNCNVFLLNASGILFGSGAQVNVGGLVASTLKMTLEDFNSGNYSFNSDGGMRSIVNAGTITAGTGGVTLMAGAVRNEGAISAQMGTVNLLSGKETVLNIDDAGNIQATVTKELLENVYDRDGNKIAAGVENTGSINADGGRVYIAAEAVKDIFENLINQEGVVKAGSMVAKDGKITLISNSEGIIRNTGTLDTSAIEAGVKGGTIEMRGEKVGQFGVVHADAVDGDGGNIDIYASNTAALSSNSLTTANAGLNGRGGEVIVYSPDTALLRRNAMIEAMGGSVSGDGGWVEVSGKEGIEIFGLVDISAANGLGGTFFIDPVYNIEITAAAGSIDASTPNFVAAAPEPVTVGKAAIETVLDADGIVLIETADNAGATGTGTVTFSTAILKDAGSGSATLTVHAADDIIINSTIGSTSGPLNINLVANGAYGTASTTGDVDINAAITTDGGTFSSSGVAFDNAGGTITTDGGNFTINHTGAVALNAGISTAAGDIDIDSTGSTVNLNSTITTTSGDIAVDAGAGSTTTVAAACDLITLTTVTFGGTRADNLTTSGDITAGGNITLNRAVTLGGSVTFDASDQTFTFGSTVNAGAYDLTVSADAISLGGNFSGTGNLVLQPVASGTTVGIGTDAAGAFSLTDAEVGYINNGGTFASITIGASGGTAAVTVNPGSGTTTFSDPITIRSGGAGGSITVNEIFTTAVSNSAITFTAGTGDTGTFTLTAGAGNTIASGSGAITISADSIALNTTANTITTTGAVTLQPNTTARPLVLAGAGAATDFALTQAEIDSIQTGYSSITIGKSGGTGTLTLTGAVDLAGETVTLRSGQINDAVNAIAANSLTMNLSSTTGANVARTTVTTLAVNSSGGSSATNDNFTVVDTADGVDLAASNTGDGNLSVTATTGNLTDSGTVTVGGTGSFTTSAAGADINLGTLAVAGTIGLTTTAANGDAVIVNATGIDFAASTVNGTLTATATTGNITDSGTVTVTGTASFTTSAEDNDIDLGTLAVTGAITLNTTSAANTATATIVNATGIDFGATTVAGDLSATATNGTITQTGGALTISGAGTFITSANDQAITLANSANHITGAISFTTNTAGGNTGHVVFDNGTTRVDFAAGGSTIDGNLTVTSGNIAGITDSGAVTVAGNAVFTTDANNGVINLNTLQADGTIRLDTNGTGAASITNDAAIQLAANTGVGGAATIIASTGNITDTGTFTVSGAGTFTTSEAAASINLDTLAVSGNISLNTSTSGNATIVNSTGINFAASNIGGNINATATIGNITDSAAVIVTGLGYFTTSAANASITLDSSLAITGSIFISTNGAVSGDATLINATGINILDASTIGRNLIVTATTGGITDAGSLTVGGTTTLTTATANNNITVDGLASTGAVSLNTTGASSNATVVNTIGLDLAASSIGGALIATATTGDLTDSGTITVGGAATFTTSNANDDVNLGTLAVTGAIILNTSGTTGNATVVNTLTTTLAASTIGGNLDLSSSNNGLTVSGAVSTAAANGSLSLNAGTNTLTTNAGATLGSGSGAITLTSDAIALGANITGTGSITLTPSTVSTGIGIGAGAGGAYNLTATEVGYLVNGFSLITIGNAAGTGAVDIQAITFHDPVTIRSPAGAGSITVNGDLQDDHGSGTLTLDGPGATTTLNADIITDQVAISISDNVEIGVASVTLDTTNSGGSPVGASISITGTTDSTVGSAKSLTLNAGTGGDITLTGVVGGTTALNGLTITQVNDATFSAAVNAAYIDQTDGQGRTWFNGNMTTTGSVGGYGIDLRSHDEIQLGNGGNIAIDAGANVIRLRSNSFDFHVSSVIASAVELGPYDPATAIGVEDNTQTLNITDAILDAIVGPVTIGDATSGAITIANGAAGGNINLTQNKNLTFISGSTINVIGVGSGPAITTTNGGAVTFTNAGLLTMNAAGDLSLAGAFLQDGAGAVSTAADITTTSDAITFTTGVTLTGDIALSNGGGANTGDIWFKSTLTGTTASTEELTLTAGAGSVKLDGTVGATRLGDLLINSALNVTPGSTITAKTFTQTTGTGTTQLDYNVDITGNINLKNGIINIGSAAGVTSAAGDITLESLTGSMSLNGNLTASGNDVTLTSAANITDTTSSDTDITATNLTITAVGSVGASGTNNELDTDVDSITASTGGNIYIYQKKAVTLPSVVTTAGVVDIEASGGITTTTVTANGGYGVVLDAAGDILQSGNGRITATAGSQLLATGIIGRMGNPVNVSIGGDLWVRAGTQQNAISVLLSGPVASSASTERVIILEPSPPGLVILNNYLMGGGNFGSGSADGSIMSFGYGYLADVSSELTDMIYEPARSWNNRSIFPMTTSRSTSIGENFVGIRPVGIDISALRPSYQVKEWVESEIAIGGLSRESRIEQGLPDLTSANIDLSRFNMPALRMEINKTANYGVIHSLK